MKVNRTPAEKLKDRITPILDQLLAALRDFDKESGAPEGMMDADMRCRVVAGISHDLQLDIVAVGGLVIPYLAEVQNNCPDCVKRRGKK